MRKLAFRESVIAFMSGENYEPYEVKVEKRRNTGKIGGYCGGKYVEECRRTFGEKNLPLICERCPE